MDATTVAAVAVKEPCEECKWWCENGDGTQRICEICTSLNADDDINNNNNNNNNNNDNSNDFPVDDGNVDFPDDDEPGEVNDIFTNAVPWREVPQKVWLRVECIHNVTTQYGPANIVELRKRGGEGIKAWTTSIIGTALAKKDKNKESKILFIKSLGKTQSKNKKTYYYNFQLKLL